MLTKFMAKERISMFKNSLNSCSAYVAFRMACLFNSTFPENNAFNINRKDLFAASNGLVMLLSIQTNLNKDFDRNITDVNNTDPFRPIAFIDHLILCYMAEVVKLLSEKAGDINEVCKAAIRATYSKSKALLMHVTLDVISNIVNTLSEKEYTKIELEDLSTADAPPLLSYIMDEDGFDKKDRELSQAMALALFGDLSGINTGLAICRVREVQIQAVRAYEKHLQRHMANILSRNTAELPVNSSVDGTAAHYIALAVKDINAYLDNTVAIPDTRIKDFVKTHVYAMFLARFSSVIKYTAIKVIKDMFSIGVIAMQCDLNAAVKTIWPEGAPEGMSDVIGNISEHVGSRDAAVYGLSPEKCSSFVSDSAADDAFNIKDLLKDNSVPGLMDIISPEGLANAKGCLTEAAFDFIIANKANVNIADQKTVIKLCLHITKDFAAQNTESEHEPDDDVSADKDSAAKSDSATDEESISNSFGKDKSKLFN